MGVKEIALKRYERELKIFNSLTHSSKDYDRTYYKLCGMESILNILGLEKEVADLQNKVHDLANKKS
jgi:hypothetical protein